MGTPIVRQPILGAGLAGAVLAAAAFSAPAILSDEDPADVVTRQTARVAVLFWTTAAAALILGHREWSRAAWVVGAATFWIHVATAFDRVHGWSHAAAVRHVSVVSGFGPGLFISYAFTVVWAADAAWWWVDRRRYEARPVWLDRGVHGFLAFVVFNGTVVYETGFIRWVGAAAFTALGLLLAPSRACGGCGPGVTFILTPLQLRSRT
jgi:hypothetical protein